MVMDMLHFHHQGLGILAEAKVPAGPPGGPSGGAPSTLVGGAPGFHGSAADSHGAENNQSGLSFYGPGFGSGVYSQGVSPMLLQATLQASGMPVILERVSAMAVAQMVPIGRGMAVFFL